MGSNFSFWTTVWLGFGAGEIRGRMGDVDKGPFKYYVIKEEGGWGQKMAILDELQYCKSSKSWVGGPKKIKNMMT